MLNLKSIIPSSFTWFEAILALLTGLSLVIFFIPKHMLSHSLEIDPKQLASNVSSDSYSTGSSSATWIDQQKQIWKCTLKEGHVSPFCSLTLTAIKEDWLGLNLSKFDRMTVWGDYSGSSEYIRIYLRNRHIDYYKIRDDSTTKYNMVEIPISSISKGTSFQLADFDVADWWVSTNKILPQYSHPEFNDVIYIEFQTGSDVREGEHQFQINRIKWEGSYISNEDLYRGMVLGWAGIVLLLLLARLAKLKIELINTNKYQQELISINKLLNLQNRQFEDLAKSDPLTGLLNRVGIRDPLMDSLNKWRSNQTPLSFALIDIDHFKNINDSLGHDAGDEVLKNTAKCLSEHIRPSDFIARWGGEEFILVLPNTNIDEAAGLAERIRSQLEADDIHPDIKVTASFGVTTLLLDDLDKLFKDADEALYQAKEEGRNRVCVKNN